MFITALTFGPVGIEPQKELDFWLGTWEVTARSRGTKPGEWVTEKGINEVRRAFSGKVIQENFKTPSLVGKSWSVYTPQLKIWRQTWVDANGSYFAFTGGAEGRNFIFKTDEVKGTTQRMVFHEIQKDQFKWDWEKTSDGGKTWTVMMQIDYARVKENNK